MDGNKEEVIKYLKSHPLSNLEEVQRETNVPSHVISFWISKDNIFRTVYKCIKDLAEGRIGI
jgi:hypothetical protein